MAHCLEHFFQFGLRLDSTYKNERQFGARQALVTLTSINLLNFADRYVPSAVKQLIIDDLHISDFASSLPTTGMIVMYMIFAVIFGYLSDRQLIDRRVILWGAAIFWSVATSLAGLSSNLLQLIMIRSLVGVGEAAYGTISPPMLSDFYPFHERNIVYGIYYLAIPIGGALGYVIGAVIGAAYGWRIAFLVCGAPGIFAAIMILRLNDPVRGINDHQASSYDIMHDDSSTVNNALLPHDSSSSYDDRKQPYDARMMKSKYVLWKEEMQMIWKETVEIMTNQHFMFATAGLVASNFALGGLADWLATYLLRYDEVSLDAAGLVVGAATIVGGIGGSILGAKVSAYYKHRCRYALFLVPAVFTVPGAACLLFALNLSTGAGGFFAVVVLLLMAAQVCIWTYLAPISAISISSIPPHLRARSCGVQIFLQHILGDIISPPIIGAISDGTGSLRFGLQLTWIFVLISGLFWYLGSRLQPLASSSSSSSDNNMIADDDHLPSSSSSYVLKAEPSYASLLTSGEDFIYKDDHVVRRKQQHHSSNNMHLATDRVTVNPMIADVRDTDILPSSREF